MTVTWSCRSHVALFDAFLHPRFDFISDKNDRVDAQPDRLRKFTILGKTHDVSWRIADLGRSVLFTDELH